LQLKIVTYYGFILVSIAMVVGIFIFKHKKHKDESYSQKLIYFIIREYPILVTIVIAYVLFNYVYFVSKFNKLDFTQLFNTVWMQWNKVIELIVKLLKLIFKTVLQKDIIKIIIIGYFASKILLNENLFEKLKYFISQIQEISFKDFSVKTQEAKKEQEIKEKEIEQIKEQEKTGDLQLEEAAKKIKDTELKKEIIALMVDNDKLVKYIDRFINKGSSSVVIPINLIPNKISLTAIEKLFDYEMGSNSIKLLRIKSEKNSIVKETFNELLSKNIIYCNE